MATTKSKTRVQGQWRFLQNPNLGFFRVSDPNIFLGVWDGFLGLVQGKGLGMDPSPLVLWPMFGICRGPPSPNKALQSYQYNSLILKAIKNKQHFLWRFPQSKRGPELECLLCARFRAPKRSQNSSCFGTRAVPAHRKHSTHSTPGPPFTLRTAFKGNRANQNHPNLNSMKRHYLNFGLIQMKLCQSSLFF